MFNTAKQFINTKQSLLFLFSKHLVSLFEQALLKTQVYFFKLNYLESELTQPKPPFTFYQT